MENTRRRWLVILANLVIAGFIIFSGYIVILQTKATMYECPPGLLGDVAAEACSRASEEIKNDQIRWGYGYISISLVFLISAFLIFKRKSWFWKPNLILLALVGLLIVVLIPLVIASILI